MPDEVFTPPKEGRTRLARRYRQLMVRRGKQQAAVAVDHQILVTAYHMLRRQEDDTEAAPAALDERRHAQTRLRAANQLRQLGFEVTLTPKEAAAWTRIFYLVLASRQGMGNSR